MSSEVEGTSVPMATPGGTCAMMENNIWAYTHPHNSLTHTHTHTHTHSPVSRLIFCLLLVSRRRSTTSCAKACASSVASFCLPWFLRGEREGLTGRKAMELWSCSVVSQTVWCVCVCVCVCVCERERERECVCVCVCVCVKD